MICVLISMLMTLVFQAVLKSVIAFVVFLICFLIFTLSLWVSMCLLVSSTCLKRKNKQRNPHLTSATVPGQRRTRRGFNGVCFFPDWLLCWPAASTAESSWTIKTWSLPYPHLISLLDKQACRGYGHPWIHGYIHVWISDFSHPADICVDIVLSHLLIKLNI